MLKNNKNLLNGARVYLAGPLEFNTDVKAISWRDYVKDQLKPLGVKCLDPTKEMFENDTSENNSIRGDLRRGVKDGRWDEVAQYFSYVIYRDARACDVSDMIIINWQDFTTPTYGTLHEAVLATQQKKVVFNICQDITNVPFWLMGLFQKKNRFYESVEECMSMIKDIDSGRVELSSKKWKLLKQELR